MQPSVGTDRIPSAHSADHLRRLSVSAVLTPGWADTSAGQDAEMLTNRVTALLGVEIPIVQAPMGWIARSTLASAVSNAGAMGIIETSSGELDVIRDEIAKMKDLTDKPFGVNIAQAFVADPTVIVDFVISQGVRFVTTSAGSPTKYTAQLKDAGL